MADFIVPSTGLLLDGFAPTTAHSPSSIERQPMQVLQLDLQENVWAEVIRCARHGGKPIHMALGKHPALQYGTKSCRLNPSLSTTDTQIFEASAVEEATSLALAGRMSHVLAMQKAQEDVAGADEALMKLQNSLASAKQAKQSNQIKYVADSSQLPPPMKTTAAILKHKHGKGNSLSFLKNSHDHPRLHNSSPGRQPSSQTASPALTPAHHDIRNIPTSFPDSSKENDRRLQAIRTPLIHLLAVRPLSTKYLAQHIHCSHDDLLKVLQKVGKEFRLDASKWDLNDRNYKDLDVWKFKYNDHHDRELAIERAISAFDRLRMSQEEPKWQLLYPPHDRGKGKTLSNLDYLHKGPIQQSNTPRIHVQHPEETNGDTQTKEIKDDQADQSTTHPSEISSHSTANGKVKKTKAGSEKEARAKRLLTNGPKKVTPASAAKDSHPAVKGRGKKGAAAPKSAELILDSDDDSLDDPVAHDPPLGPTTDVDQTKSVASTPPVNGVDSKVKKVSDPESSAGSKPAQTHKGERKLTTNKPPKAVANGNRQAAVEAKDDSKPTTTGESKVHHKKVPSSPAYTPGAKQRLSDSSQGSTSVQKALPRGRAISSPHKPSPLGSSPPTNASEFDNVVRSSISTTPPSSKKSVSSGDTNGSSGPLRADSLTPLKLNGTDQSPSSSDASLKRKANDMDSGIHNHASPYMNGYATSVKRQKPSLEPTPPESDDSSPSPLSEREVALQEAQRFKSLHAKYAKVYREVSQLSNPPADKIQLVRKMHKRLEEMKRSITLGMVGF